MTIRAGGLIDIADFGTDGEQAVTIIGGMTDPEVTAWLQGGLAGIEFVARLGTVTHNTLIGTFPTGYRPKRLSTVVLVPNSFTPDHAFIQIATTGEIMFYMYGSGSGTTLVRGGGAWPRQVP